ncbi:hypothetical protein BJY00DRAFT_208905 [Aspergillus carlsbadensis]|nr:hypothetical protein BJY00DRAFT_208905 [Aspergillus carlsbadensis]
MIYSPDLAARLWICAPLAVARDDTPKYTGHRSGDADACVDSTWSRSGLAGVYLIDQMRVRVRVRGAAGGHPSILVASSFVSWTIIKGFHVLIDYILKHFGGGLVYACMIGLTWFSLRLR